MRHGKLWWLVLAVIVIVGSGGAAGTVLTGLLAGTATVDVSPPLKLEQPVVQSLPQGQDFFASLNIDRTTFRVIAQVQPGDCFLISLPVVNSAAVDIKSLLNLSYSNGIVLSITGSGVINDVVALSYHTWKFTADAGAQGTNASPFDGVYIEVDVLPSFVGTSVEISGSIVATTGVDGAYLVYPFLPTQDVLYLHNNPSPPIVDTNSQANLSMDMYPGTAAVLYNYDQDRDSSPGRVILHGGSGAAETNLAKYQNWQMAVSRDLKIGDIVTAVLWSAAKNSARGIVTVYLRDLGDSSSEIASGTLDLSPWQQGSSTWVERKIKITIPGGSYTVPAGHILELKMIVGNDSSDMLFAYDTILYPSRLILESKPIAGFSANFVSSSNQTVTVAFTDLSTSDEGIVSWLWAFGGSSNSTQQNPTHTYSSGGTYTVKLTVTEADGDTGKETKTAVVTTTGVTLLKVLPVADFSASPTYGMAPLKVGFTDLSTSSDDIASWLWNFGDGGASAQQNPAHIYTSWGIFTVSLTASEADGDRNTKTKTNYIFVLEPIPPTVSTNAATNITTTTARLNGTLSSLGTASTVDVSFQWGTSPGVYPNQTTPQTMSAPGTFYFDLSGLTPGRTYYFRAKAVGHDTSYGSELSFSTLGTLYLHNNPTPPDGNTDQQANLPMNTSAPTASVLYNYDTNKNPDPGRTINKGGSGPGETDLNKYQNWRMTATSDLSINGNVNVVLWSAMKNFDNNKRGVVTVYLRDFDGSTYTEIANGTLDLASWQGGSGTWVGRTVTVAGVNYTLVSGHILEVKVIVDGASADNMRFAYDTTSYPSRIALP